MTNIFDKDNILFQKRRCPDYEFALDYESRLKAAGFAEVKVKNEFGKWYVYYKRY